MQRIAMLIALGTAACASNDPANYLSVYLDSATVKLVGNKVDEIVVDVTLTGPHDTGSPIYLDSAELDDNSYSYVMLASLSLTAGDQTWGDQPIALVDDGTDPDPLLSLCGRSIQLGACIGSTILDTYWDNTANAPASHQETSCGPLGPVTVDCD